MDQNWRPAVQVVINGNSHGQAQGSNGPYQQRHTRPLVVDEALQYSPMSSSPAFGLGMIDFVLLFDMTALADPLLSCQTAFYVLISADPPILPLSIISSRLDALLWVTSTVTSNPVVMIRTV